MHHQKCSNIRIVHEGEKPYKCTQCEAKYSSKNSLELHISYFHEGKKPLSLIRQPVKCDICNKQYSNKKTMRSHMKYVHEKVFKFTCDLCNKVLHSKGSLKGHISTVHEGAKPYKVSLIFWNCKKGLCTSRPYLTFILGTVSQKSQCMHQIYCTGVFLLCQNGPEYKYAQRMILGPTILL